MDREWVVLAIIAINVITASVQAYREKYDRAAYWMVCACFARLMIPK